MSNTFKGYELFNDMEDDLLQAWNRAQVIANINEDIGPDAAEEYANKFSELEQMKFKLLLMAVSMNGKEEVQKRINDAAELES